ncbi:HAMP domain-containing sensor histidine kinase [Amycolatopsis saalfeldensis]|uniref:histidine kinase n=1 Tax=Amycolatopsis saalfeldensis TaxID=394193 RepID=A0A1H8U590_9PSEU|nr:HAMP domain-containing sensor histidine kinase [Amycolatopsis saalfeldensis]SEO98440.1 Signal transduction histidine kinase [Amycolatopsis saalfeldensis]
MRRRIILLAAAAALLATSLFGIPLAVAVANYFTQDERTELERTADAAALSIADDVLAHRSLPEFPGSEEDTTGLYAPAGALLTGGGPASADPVVSQARDGQVATGEVGAELVVAVPILQDGRLSGIVRTSAPLSDGYQKIAISWLAMAGLATAAIVLTGLLAARLAARIARPLEKLSAAAGQLGDGDFSVRAPVSGIAEIDRLGGALDRSAARIADALHRQRALAADASHQLRTPLAGLRLQLESALDPPGQNLAAAVEAAITTTDRLETTIDDVVTLANRPPEDRGVIEPEALLRDVVASWRDLLTNQGRRLVISPGADGRPRAAEAAVRQIIGVLLDNAVVHGEGRVTITTRDSADAFAIDVADEGHGTGDGQDLFIRGHSGAGSTGIGLALARELAEAEGGRLWLSRPAPTTFTLVLPPARAGQQIVR